MAKNTAQVSSLCVKIIRNVKELKKNALDVINKYYVLKG
jgi:hypothetical protein